MVPMGLYKGPPSEGLCANVRVIQVVYMDKAHKTFRS